VPYRKLYEVLRWNMDHGCDSVHSLNKLIKTGGFPDLIQAADKRYVSEILLAADRIIENRRNIRIVIIAGPSSSGKTTTTIKLSEQLARSGIGFKAINIDNYFFDLDKHPRDEFGDYDYETPQALDLELINRHLVMLLDGRTVKTPHYDFKAGIRRLDIHDLKLEKNEILLIDSLHGLFDRMTSSVPARKKFKLYIETLGQFRGEDGTLMRWSDNRLLRRMIRDKNHRNLKPIQTLTHWHYVRRSELKNIIPYIKSTDCIVNSALPYELPLLKPRLFTYINKAIHSFGDDPKRLDAHIRANRVHDLMKSIKAVKDDSCVPSDSLLREFIGGSRYRY
jgi:uridine kinase